MKSAARRLGAGQLLKLGECFSVKQRVACLHARQAGGPRSVFYPGDMGTVWVLHTETKGTGATMVPLESVTKRSSAAEPPVVPRKPRPRPEQPPQARAPRRFRVRDVMTRQTLVDDVSARRAIDVLKDVRSIIDVNVYVWQEERDRWRMLTFPERRAMWELAGR